ncbi:MAG TPA: hypothetical protein VH370_23025 [Humisphaera sp.]|nr:hypothetical protein [Humisphaera sp.]
MLARARAIVARHRSTGVKYTIVLALEARAAYRHLSHIAPDLIADAKIIVIAVPDALDPAVTRDYTRDVMVRLILQLLTKEK